MDPTRRPSSRQRSGVRPLTDSASLSALAHPFRARIMDALAVDGPSTTSALAARTGQAIGSASHHLRVLGEAGLVEEAPELARDRRERWWRLVTPGTSWSWSDLEGDAAALAAGRELETLQVRRQLARLEDWLANSSSDPDWQDAAYATQSWLVLSPDELRAVAEEVMDVFARWRTRAVPDDGVPREPVVVFSRGFPSQP